MPGLALAVILSLLPAPPAISNALASPIAYSGTIPCADCPGIRMTLNLLTDGTFLLRQEYLERKSVFVEVGRWAIEWGKLTLLGSGERPDYFRVLNPQTIRKLDGEGREIKTQQNYDLKRETVFSLIRDPARLSGTVISMAGAASITLCPTGQTLPVVGEGDFPSLEKEYGAKRPAPNAPLLVTVGGHFVERPGGEGGGTQRVFVVDQFEKALPGEACPPLKEFQTRRSMRTPEGDTWTLVSLRGRTVSAGPQGMAPYLRFDVGSHRLTGHTGCNRLSGRYEMKGDSVTLSHFVVTRRACKDGGDVETRLLTLLPDVTGWSLSGDRLTLYARKEIVAEFVMKDE